ncbi:MAG: HEAT repeat domain-containing protein [Chloroflexi bacterium]|nr:HEAT repeat domain-containing protein [Chloroflexota bacterium]
MPKKKEKSLGFDEALMQMDGVEAPNDEALCALSGAGAEQQPAFEKMWRTLDADRRTAICERLIEIAHDDVEMEFTLVFRIGLRDADARVRLAAAHGLWEEASPDVITPLVQVLRTDADLKVRAAAAQSLGHFLYASEIEELSAVRGREIYSALLMTLRRTDDESSLYQRALESIAYSGTVDVDFFLRSVTASDDAGLKMSGVIGMGRSNNHEYQSLVRAELHHVSPHVRREAARAAGELEDVDAVKDLAELIDDSERAVCEAALESLAQVGSFDAKRIIESVIASADDDLKEKAEEALQMYEMLHGDFDFNVNIFDEESRTSFHALNAVKMLKFGRGGAAKSDK